MSSTSGAKRWYSIGFASTWIYSLIIPLILLVANLKEVTPLFCFPFIAVAGFTLCCNCSFFHRIHFHINFCCEFYFTPPVCYDFPLLVVVSDVIHLSGSTAALNTYGFFLFSNWKFVMQITCTSLILYDLMWKSWITQWARVKPFPSQSPNRVGQLWVECFDINMKFI